MRLGPLKTVEEHPGRELFRFAPTLQALYFLLYFPFFCLHLLKV